MAVAVKNIRITESRRHRTRWYALTLTGSYPALGDNVDFTTQTSKEARQVPPSNPLPSLSDISIESVPDGYTVALNPNGTAPTLKNFLLTCFSTANTPIATAAYPTGLLNGVVVISITKPKSDG